MLEVLMVESDHFEVILVDVHTEYGDPLVCLNLWERELAVAALLCVINEGHLGKDVASINSHEIALLLVKHYHLPVADSSEDHEVTISEVLADSQLLSDWVVKPEQSVLEVKGSSDFIAWLPTEFDIGASEVDHITDVEPIKDSVFYDYLVIVGHF